MKNKITRILAVGMVLTMIASFFAAVPVSAAPGVNEWDQIDMPVLEPGTDVGVMAITPDGETIFAAMYDEIDGTWAIMRSDDGGFNWDATNLTGLDDPDPLAWMGGTFNETPVAISVAPNWPADQRIYVATVNGDVYRIPNGGNGTPIRLITIVDSYGSSLADANAGLWDMDIYSDGTNNYLAVATDLDVFVLRDALLQNWLDMELATDGNFGNAVEVDFAPDFDTSNLLWAMVGEVGAPAPRAGFLGMTSTVSPGQWGDHVAPVTFENVLDAPLPWSPYVDVAFASNYTSQTPVLYAGIAIPFWWGPTDGNIFQVMGTFNATDPGDTTAEPMLLEDAPIGSIEVSGNVIMGINTETGVVITSDNSGNTFDEALRSPAGMYWGHVYMFPDFAESDKAIAGLFDYMGMGGISGIYLTSDGGMYWDGISYLDLTINEILDITFKPGTTSNQPTLLLVEAATGGDYIFYSPDATAAAPQWLLKDNNDTFGLIDIGMLGWSESGNTAMFIGFDGPNYEIYRSTDDGNSFSIWRAVSGVVGVPYDWVVVDGATVKVVGAGGFWGTRAVGTAFTSTTPAPGYSIAKYDQTLAVGTQNGKVTISTDNGASWKTPATIGTGNVVVAFGPAGQLYAATEDGHLFAVKASNLSTTTVVDSMGDFAAGDSFSGLKVSADNTLYAIGGETGAMVYTGTEIGAGSIDLVDTVTDTVLKDEFNIAGFEITNIAGGPFSDGEAINILAANVKAISSSIAEGVIYLEGDTSGATGEINIQVFDNTAGGPFSQYEFYPVDLGVVAGDTAITADVQSMGGATNTSLFRLLLDETGAVWQMAPIADATGLYLTHGSNLLWTLVGAPIPVELWALEDFLSGQVAGVTVSEVNQNPAAQTKSLKVSWAQLEGADEYELNVYQSGTSVTAADQYYFTVPSGTATGDTLSMTIPGFAYSTAYSVQVRVNEDSPLQSRLSAAASTTTEAFILPPVPQAPVQGLQGAPLNPSFVWQAATGAASYDFQLTTDPTFSSLITSENGITATAFTYTGELDYDTNHYWRVRSTAADGVKSAWSTIQNFHTMQEAIPPVTVTENPAATLTVSVPPPVTISIPPAQTVTVSVPPAVTLTQTVTSVPVPTIVLPEEAGTPMWVWIIVAVGAVLTIAVIVLIVRTRRVE